jgi:hypothetical protein
MLYEFISLNRDNIVRRARDRVRGRPWPAVSGRELEHGVPLFLTQLAETLRLEGTSSPFASDAIGSTGARHGCVFSIDLPLVHDPESFSGLNGNPAVPPANAARTP